MNLYLHDIHDAADWLLVKLRAHGALSLHVLHNGELVTRVARHERKFGETFVGIYHLPIQFSEIAADLRFIKRLRQPPQTKAFDEKDLPLLPPVEET